jgi:hypothetical protein
MTMTIPLASTLPENSNDGYVAAAYIVFFAIVLIYVAIMAIRLSRVERDARGLRARAERPWPEHDLGRTPGEGRDEAQDASPSGQTREREPA